MHYAVKNFPIPETNLSEDHLYSFDSKIDRDDFLVKNPDAKRISYKEQKKLPRFVEWGVRYSATDRPYWISLVELG